MTPSPNSPDTAARPRMQLTKPVQTSNAGLVTPSNTLGAPAPASPGPQLPTPSAGAPAMSYMDIARNALAKLTDDEVQTLLKEVLAKQTTPTAADMFNSMKGATSV